MYLNALSIVILFKHKIEITNRFLKFFKIKIKYNNKYNTFTGIPRI
jgi:hypothetical protein